MLLSINSSRRRVDQPDDFFSRGAGARDGILPPNFASRAYFGLNNVVEGSQSPLHYYEVTNAQHLDDINALPGFDTIYILLLRYFIQAMDLMYDHLRNGRALPPSQVVHTVPRGGTPGAAPADHPCKRTPDRGRAVLKRRDHLQKRAGEYSGLKPTAAVPTRLLNEWASRKLVRSRRCQSGPS
jgi:hypothetical protein